MSPLAKTAITPRILGVEPELTLTVPEEKCLDEEDKRRLPIHHGCCHIPLQASRYDILFDVSQLVRAMSKPSKAHLRAVEYLLWYLAGSVNFLTTYKQGGFKLAAYFDANWCTNSDNDKYRSSDIVMLTNGPISVKVGLQSLTTQSSIEVKFVTAALTMKITMSCFNMMVEVGFKKGLSSVPLCRNNTSTLHVTGNRIYSPRAKNVALRYFFVQDLVQEGKITIHCVNTHNQFTDLGTNYLGRYHHRALIKLINDFKV